MFYLKKEKIVDLNIKSMLERNQDRLFEYDRKGNMVSYINKDSKIFYKYDTKGNEIECKSYNDNELVYHITFEYIFDNLNRIIEKRRWELSGGLIDVLDYEYDNDGNIIEEVLFTDDIITEKKVYNYNTKGERIEEFYFPLNSGEIKVFNKFDYYGNKIESLVINDDGSEQAKWFWKFDQKGNNIEFKSINYMLKINQKDIIEYTNEGLVIKNSIYFEKDSPSIIEEYEYVYFK